MPRSSGGQRQLLEDPHPVEAAQRAAAHVVATVDRGHPKASRFTQLVDRKVLCGIPFQRVRGQFFSGECGGRLGDDPFVVIQAEKLHRRD